jgi:hypothetical protein
MRTHKQQILSKSGGYITIDIPPIPFPTPVTAARWFATNPAMRALYFVIMGIGIGYFGHVPSALPKIFPPPVITVTETLEDFVARESQGLTADERLKLMAVIELVLAEHFDTPSAIREKFRYERRKAGIDSPAFTAFNEKLQKELGVRSQELEESVEGMQRVYESLLQGLQSKTPNFYLLTPNFSLRGEPVEGFVCLPSNVSPNDLGGDVPVSPPVVRRQPFLQRRR